MLLLYEYFNKYFIYRIPRNNLSQSWDLNASGICSVAACSSMDCPKGIRILFRARYETLIHNYLRIYLWNVVCWVWASRATGEAAASNGCRASTAPSPASSGSRASTASAASTASPASSVDPRT